MPHKPLARKDGSLDSRGECFSGAAGFYHEALGCNLVGPTSTTYRIKSQRVTACILGSGFQMGSLEVRGADPAQMLETWNDLEKC